MTDATSLQTARERAESLYRAGEYRQAAQAFAGAAESCSAAGETLMGAELKNDQSVALLRAGNAREALEAAEGTERVFAAAGDARREGIAYANQAAAQQALHHAGPATVLFEKSGALLEAAGEGELHLEVMQSLSVLYLRQGKLLKAVIALQSGLAGVKNPTPRQKFMKALLSFRL